MFLVALALAWLTPAAGLAQNSLTNAEHWNGSIDARNRWVDRSDTNRDVYRSVVNLGEGPRLFDADLAYADPLNRAIDEMTFSATGWGGDPASTALFRAQKRELYELRIDFRNIAYFNNLPSFANPLLAEDVLLSQQAIDIRRRMLDAEFRLRPGSSISPYVAFYRAGGLGTGFTTFVTDANEFPVNNRVDDTIWSLRGGADMRYKWLSLKLEHGHTDYSDRQSLFFDEGGNLGNRRTTFLGQEIVLDSLSQSYRANGSGFFERAVLQGAPNQYVSFSGQFQFSQNRMDATQDLAANGDFALLALLRRFSGQVEQSFADAKRPRTAGSFGVELRPTSKLRITENWFTDRYHISSGASIVQTLNTTPETLLNTLTAQTLSFRYNQNQAEAIYQALPWLTLRGGHRAVWGSARTPLDPRFVQGPASREGKVRRQVGLAGGAIRAGKFRGSADFEAAQGERTFFRTGLLDYQQARFRARYDLSPQWTLTGSFRRLDNENPDPAIELDFSSQQASGGVRWTSPDGTHSLLLDYTRSTIHSDIRIVDLPFFGQQIATYRDNAHLASAFYDMALPGDARVSVGGSLVRTSGSRPTDFYRPRGQVAIPMMPGVFWVAEWNWFGFHEEFFRQEDFRAHMLSVGLLWDF